MSSRDQMTKNDALCRAVRDRDQSRVREALKEGAEVNARDGNRETPLILATMALSGSETVKVLIEAGADVNAVDGIKETALMKVAERGGRKSIKALIKAGADVDVKDKDGRTALMKAVKCGYEGGETVKVLIDAGADIEARDMWGATVTNLAKSSPQYLEIIQTARSARRAAELDQKLNQACDSWAPPAASSSTIKSRQTNQDTLTQAEQQAPVSRSRQRF